jgi:hypothetical protein
MRNASPALPLTRQCLPDDVSGLATSQNVESPARHACSCYTAVGRASLRESNGCVVCQQQQLGCCHPLLGQESRDDDVHAILERRSESVVSLTAAANRKMRVNLVPTSELLRYTNGEKDRPRQQSETVTVA